MSDTNFDRLHENVLDHIDRSERNKQRIILAAAVWEALLLAGFCLKADFHNSTHILLLIALIGGYSMVWLGLAVLGNHTDRGILRVLQAVERLRDERKRAEDELG